ncbi:MAG: acyl-CoA thioesterase [Planctomycetota bacterium]
MTVFDLHHTVTAEEIDAQDHVHNLRYLRWALWAAGKHLASLGFDAEVALDAGRGWVVRDHQITYRRAAKQQDDVVIRTWISDVRKYAVTRGFLITRQSDQSILARGRTRWVYVDLRRHRALMIPEEFQKSLFAVNTPPPPWER